MDKSAAALYDVGGGEVHETKTDQRIPDFAAAERLHCDNETKYRADDGSKSNDTRRNSIHNGSAAAARTRNNGSDSCAAAAAVRAAAATACHRPTGTAAHASADGTANGSTNGSTDGTANGSAATDRSGKLGH